MPASIAENKATLPTIASPRKRIPLVREERGISEWPNPRRLPGKVQTTVTIDCTGPDVMTTRASRTRTARTWGSTLRNPTPRKSPYDPEHRCPPTVHFSVSTDHLHHKKLWIKDEYSSLLELPQPYTSRPSISSENGVVTPTAYTKRNISITFTIQVYPDNLLQRSSRYRFVPIFDAHDGKKICYTHIKETTSDFGPSRSTKKKSREKLTQLCR